jgi:hypothetical protein
MIMPNIPLLDLWNAFFPNQPRSKSLFIDFVNQQLTATNVGVPGSTATVLYSGTIGDEKSYLIAQNMAARSNGKLRIIDNTNIGQFLDYMLYNDGVSTLDFEPLKPFIDARWSDASATFAEHTTGPVMTITSDSLGNRVYSQTEIDAIMKSGATHINGRSIADIRDAANNFTDPAQKRAYLKAMFDGDFSRELADGRGTKLLSGTVDGKALAALDIDQATLNRFFGSGVVTLNPPSAALSLVLNEAALASHLADSRARALLAQTLFDARLNDNALILNRFGPDLQNGFANIELTLLNDKFNNDISQRGIAA